MSSFGTAFLEGWYPVGGWSFVRTSMRLMRPDSGLGKVPRLEEDEESQLLRLQTAAFSFRSIPTCRLENRRRLGDFESSMYSYIDSYVDGGVS